MNNTMNSLDDILSKLKIVSLNEMQNAAITSIIEKPNTLILSPTGSGKTLAFLLPLIQLFDKSLKTTQAIIIVPSRELALQIEAVFKSMGTAFKVTCCYGGHLRETEENNLKQPPALLIGTPGRLADHIRRGNITTSSISTIIIDEFDKSLELGFLEEMSFIVNALPAINKRVLTSATEAVEIPLFLDGIVFNQLNFNHHHKHENALSIRTLISSEKDKLETLFRLVCMVGHQSTIIFCNHRDAVERVYEFLKSKQIVCVFYHGALEQKDRDVALCKFRNGSSNILVTTDLAARGLDIAHIRYIVHYHLPATEDIFTHRNGRTARMNATGTAIIVLGPDETLPGYITLTDSPIQLPDVATLPEKPKWSTLFIAAGKKNKLNKVDIVGFFTNKAHLKKEDIGLIDVKDFFSFVAIRKSKVNTTIELIKNQKIKNKNVKIAIAK